MIRHDIDFCKNERLFMPLNIFSLNRILFMMIPFSDKTFEKLEKRIISTYLHTVFASLYGI